MARRNVHRQRADHGSVTRDVAPSCRACSSAQPRRTRTMAATLKTARQTKIGCAHIAAPAPKRRAPSASDGSTLPSSRQVERRMFQRPNGRESSLNSSQPALGVRRLGFNCGEIRGRSVREIHYYDLGRASPRNSRPKGRNLLDATKDDRGRSFPGWDARKREGIDRRFGFKAELSAR